jgi:alginate O-acetyltransferase complex protein AlgI
MLFNSLAFAIFLPLVLVVYYLLPHKAQNVFLLAASIFFYACWDWRFLFPLLASTSIDYFCASRLQDLHEAGAPASERKKYLLISVITNLGLLGFFKYFNFFSTSLESLLGMMGLHANLWTLRVILPIGISFYTFQALSYTIDVYRGELHSTRNFRDFLLAVLYFPHLVAGPIQRASNLLPQVVEPRKITAEKIRAGIHLIFCGYFKKVFIADNLAPIANHVFANPSPTGFETLIGVYAFAFQIYCDFSGYTDIARGVAKIMGFEFMLNFRLPYLATNPSDFWQRWHISLSSWLRDYLYIPLGGNRSSTAKTYRNLMLTMVIGGLWHGASWNFVLWGFYHGSLLILHRLLSPISERLFATSSPLLKRIGFVASAVLMFQFTCYGWLLFRANSFAQIFAMTKSLLHPFLGVQPQLALKVFAIASPLLLIQPLQYAIGKLDLFDFRRIPLEARAVAYAVLAYFALFLGGQPQSFIYFQF